MTLAVAEMKAHIAAEKARLGLSATQTRHLRNGCRQALLAAWLASHHLALGGGQSTFTHERTPEEPIMPNRWPRLRQNVARYPNTDPTPAAMTQTPAQYNLNLGFLLLSNFRLGSLGLLRVGKSRRRLFDYLFDLAGV